MTHPITVERYSKASEVESITRRFDTCDERSVENLASELVFGRVISKVLFFFSVGGISLKAVVVLGYSIDFGPRCLSIR